MDISALYYRPGTNLSSYRVRSTGIKTQPQNRYGNVTVYDDPAQKPLPQDIEEQLEFRELKEMEYQGRVPYRAAGNSIITPSSGSTSHH